MDSSRRIDLGLSRESAEVEAFVKCLHDTPTAPGFDRVQYPGEFEAANREQRPTPSTSIRRSGATWNSWHRR